MVLEITASKIPVANWIKSKIHKFLINKLKRLSPAKKNSIFGLKNQQMRLKIKAEIRTAMNPEITPWTKNGPLMNQFEAPTNLWILISSIEFKIANLIVLKVTKMAVIIKIIERKIPVLLKRDVREKIFSITGFLL